MAYFTAVFTGSERQHELSCLTQLSLVLSQFRKRMKSL